jgi:hypothetical protein
LPSIHGDGDIVAGWRAASSGTALVTPRDPFRIVLRCEGRRDIVRAFAELTEQEILALAIAAEEEDARIYADYADGLKPGSVTW